jgi:hypothetical protein
VITNDHGITREAEHVGYTSAVSKEEIRLQGQAIAIPARHLENGLASHLLDHNGPSQRRVSQYRALIVGNVHGIDTVFE